MGALLPVPYVHTVHGSWEPHVVPVYSAVSDRVRLVAISKSQQALAPASVRVPDVVYNGIEVDSFPFRDATQRGGGALAFVGRATPDKGADVAIRVAKKLGRPLRMAIKVNEPAEHRYWDEVLEPLLAGVDVRVLFNADRMVAAQLMAGADITLMPICWPEPFGLVMVESMAVGTPVVAYAVGAASEIVADGRSGALVSPDGGVSEFCAAVDRAAMVSPSDCRDWVRARFSARAMVAGYERVYAGLVRERVRVRLPVDAMS
jgi:glycosyltransferase involved in cell wall biosynthesis